MDAAGCLQVVATAGSREEAQRLAALLVEARLAACAQVVGPIHSTYRWQGAVETAEEWMLVAKTAAERLTELVERVRAEHSYDVPEVVATTIAGGNPAYLDWIRAETLPPA
jgi:periplasmic divalent cation tolerance protein